MEAKSNTTQTVQGAAVVAKADVQARQVQSARPGIHRDQGMHAPWTTCSPRRHKTAATYAHTAPDFALVGVETANRWQGSIWQSRDLPCRSWRRCRRLANPGEPQEPFDRSRMRVHGITPEQVDGAPVWSDISPDVQRRLLGLVVSHGPFDKSALRQSCRRHGLRSLQRVEWRDSATLARHTWPERCGNYVSKYTCKHVLL